MLFFEGVNTHHIWWIIKGLGQGSEWMTSQNHWGLKSKRATLSVLNNIFFLPFSSESWNSSSRDSAAPTELSSTAGGGGSWMICEGGRGENKHCMSGRKGRNVTPNLANIWIQNRPLYNLHVTAMCPLCATSWLHNNTCLRVSSALQKPCADLQMRLPDFFFSFLSGIFKGQGRILTLRYCSFIFYMEMLLRKNVHLFPFSLFSLSLLSILCSCSTGRLNVNWKLSLVYVLCRVSFPVCMSPLLLSGFSSLPEP